MRNLEIGCGHNPVNKTWDTAGFDDQWGFKPLPFDADTFDFVYASHVLEHIPWTHTLTALKDAYRVLKPGGKAEFWVPNFAYIVQCYHDRKCGDSWRRHNKESDFMKWVNGRIFTYGPGADNWHHCMFDATSLHKYMRQAGFTNVRILGPGDRTIGTPHGPIDLGARAEKAI